MPVNGSVDTNLTMLNAGIWDSALNPGKNGRNFPIDSSKYQVLSYKIYVGGLEDPQIFWVQQPGRSSVKQTRRPYSAQVDRGYPVGVADLTQVLLPGLLPWTDGLVQGLRFDPNAFNAVGNIYLYWMRLTPSPSSPLAAKRTISWSGTGTATMTVRDNSDGAVFPLASNVSGNSYLWNYGVLAPGSYTLIVTNASGSGQATFSINNPTSIEITNPSMTSGPDYATTVLGNPWDMSSAADIQLTGSDYLTNLSFSGGMLHATNTINDPNVTLLYNTNNSVPIDTSRFRYLTYSLQVDGPYDLGAGSVARVVWNSQLLMSGTTATVSQDIIVWPGMNSYTIDLASLSAAPDGGLEPVSAGEPWTAGVKRHLRLDPHEFPQARTFHIDDVKLTAKPVAGSTFPIMFLSADADGDAATVSLYYDTDTNPGNGRTLIASGIPRSAGQFVWNTAGVPQGEYFIYAEATDGVQSLGRYSSVPVQVAPSPADTDRVQNRQIAARRLRASPPAFSSHPDSFHGCRRTDTIRRRMLDPTGRPNDGRQSFLPWLVFLSYALLMASWIVGNPPYGGPDEWSPLSAGREPWPRTVGGNAFGPRRRAGDRWTDAAAIPRRKNVSR